MEIKLNIGAGKTEIDGWIPIDRNLGYEAWPLPSVIEHEGQTVELAKDSVDEIRASHILEHFSFRDARAAVADWVRVLKPGGRLRIAVPDFDKVASASDDPKRLYYMMGGQTDSNDVHKSAYDEQHLRAVMLEAGLGGIQHWTSANTDCASLPISLNLEGIKGDDVPGIDVKIGAFMTLPRYEAAVARSIIEESLRPLGIGLSTSQGVFWGQCMQRMFETAIADGLDWILSIDSDSLFSAMDVSKLLDEFARMPEAGAMAALQCRRGRKFPLMTCGHEEHVETDGSPILVTTAHFGLTLIRVEDLLKAEKPWFKSEPDKDGGWGDDRLDDDIWFWHQWRLAGLKIYVTPRVSIGHLEETVAVFDDNLQPSHLYVSEWREKNLES